MRTCLAFLAAFVATPALAAEPVGDAPVPTAGRPANVADQIDAYLRTSPAAKAEADGVDGVVTSDDRRPHGVVSVGIGTHGYRSIYMRSDMPIGESGRLSVAIEDTRYGRGDGRGFGHGFGEGPGFGAPIDRQRCDIEGLSPARPLDVTGGPHGRCVRLPGR